MIGYKFITLLCVLDLLLSTYRQYVIQSSKALGEVIFCFLSLQSEECFQTRSSLLSALISKHQNLSESYFWKAMILFTDVHRFFSRLTDWMIQSHSENTRIGQDGKVEVGSIWNTHIHLPEFSYIASKPFPWIPQWWSALVENTLVLLSDQTPWKHMAEKSQHTMAWFWSLRVAVAQKRSWLQDFYVGCPTCFLYYIDFIGTQELTFYSTCPVLLGLSPCIIWNAKS